MIDCIEAIAAPQSATAYVRPSALIFTVEEGEHVLYVTRSREETLRLLSEKRAATRDERYKLSLEIVEASVLPERSDIPTVMVAPATAVGMIMDAVFQAMPRLDVLQELIDEEVHGLDAFRLPRGHAGGSGFGVVRTQAGPLLETFHSREQAVGFLKRHEDVISEADMRDAYDEFGYSRLAARSTRMPEAFGGFAAAIAGAPDRLRRRVLARLGKR